MLPGLLTAFFFSLSAIFSQRATRLFGALPAHFFRLTWACVVLGLMVWAGGVFTMSGELVLWFLASGALGFGLGDACLFAAYPRLGSRIVLLVQFCVSAMVGALGDFFWLGKALSLQAACAVTTILAGLAITRARQSVANPEPSLIPVGTRRAGWLFALGSAVFMGIGTVVSHHAISHVPGGNAVPPISQAWMRVTAGMGLAGLLFLLQRWLYPAEQATQTVASATKGQKLFWLAGTSLMGPVLGVSCYQWALGELRSSAVVLAMAATSAIFILPMARMWENDRFRWHEVLGTVVAVGGIVWLRIA